MRLKTPLLTPKDSMPHLIACLRNARHEMYGDTPPFISEGIFSDIAVEGTTDKTGIHMDMPAVILPDANFELR